MSQNSYGVCLSVPSYTLPEFRDTWPRGRDPIAKGRDPLGDGVSPDAGVRPCIRRIYIYIYNPRIREFYFLVFFALFSFPNLWLLRAIR